MKTTTKPVAKERIRGNKLRVLVRRTNGVAFERALVLVDEANGVIASSKRMDKALVGSNEWKQVKEGLWCWTGTMTGYKEPKKKLGANIEYTDPNTKIKWVFPVPKEYKNIRNAILVAEQSDYELEKDGNNRVVHAENVAIIKAFPAEDGWYLTDSVHGIPTGTEVDSSNSDARYLWRIEKRVGPVARVYGNFGDVRWRNVDLYYWPSVDLGVVVVEATKGGALLATADTPKLQVTEQPGKLIVEGTPEQLARVKEFAGKLEK